MSGHNLPNELSKTQSDLSGLGVEKNYIQGEVIVKFKSGIHLSEIQSLQSNLGASVLQSTTISDAQLWQLNGLSVEEAIATYGTNPLIEYIQPNYNIFLNATIPNDPNVNELWGLNNIGQAGGTPDADIDAPEAWDIQTGNNVVVGVIDTGVDYTHPDLVNNMWTNQVELNGSPGVDDDGNGYVDDIHGYDFVNNDGNPMDDNGHGTHVSGTIAAEGNNGIGVSGVSWSSKIMALKFLGANGSGTLFNAIKAIEYATMMGAKITNNSWSGGGYSQALYDAIAAAGTAGQLFIAAAGNSSNNNDLNPSYPASYNLDNIISVAATDRYDQLAGFSSYGATSVDLAAPGVSIYSTVPGGGYASYSGTSMATPHVTGVASLIWAQKSELSASEVKELILATVDPIAALKGKTLTGGRLNAYNALIAVNAGEIQGSKWHDLDNDGVWGGNEPGLVGWTLYLDQNQNNQLDQGEISTVTDVNGHYAFKFLQPGTYRVAEVLKPGWTQTYPTESDNYTLEVAENQTISGVNFGNILTNPAEIHGSTWNDLNKNGIKDAGEAALAGWTLYLDQNQNNQLDQGELSTITDTNGTYSFTKLSPDTYTVAQVIQPEWEQIYPVVGVITEIFNADFSDDSDNPSLDGFVIDNTGATVGGLWHLSQGRGNQPGHSADDSMYFGKGEDPNGGGNYNVGDTAGRITSPEIDLTSVSNAELSFNYFLKTEDAAPSWDNARVLISKNGGSFSAIASNATQLTDPTTDWAKATLDLTSYVGSTIRVQFDFDTGDSVGNNYEGWYVDDVKVNSVGKGTHQLNLSPNDIATNINFGNRQIQLIPSLNLSFETGDFTDWNTIGQASLETAALGSNPTDGEFQALITTSSGAVSDAAIETFLGLNAGALDNLGNGDAIEGSALQLTPITVKAGDILSFSWNLLTNEKTPSNFNDFVFVSITSGLLSELADTNSNFSRFAGSFGSETGYGTSSYQFTQAGTFTIGLGVVDGEDSSVDSGLLVDKFQIVADPVFNFGFENGDFANWNVTGNASIKTANFGSNPTQGNYQALITNGSGAVSDAQLETALGLNTGAIDALGNGNATQGSALQFQPLTVAAGDILTFNWNFLTNEITPSSFNDFGFVTISNGSLSELADTNSSFIPLGSSFNEQTGYGTFTYQFTQASTFKVGVGVVDVGDTVVDSGLLVDNFQIVADPVFNFGFENGDFANWNVTGNASIKTANFGSNPTQGNYQALITNGSGAVSDAQLETALGLNTGAIDALGNGNATQGSALQFQPLTVAAGDILTFNWNFLTNEITPSSFNDFGFVTISNGSLSELADTNSSFIPLGSSFNEQTGYGTFTYQFTQAGTFKVGVGVVDVGDTIVDSGLLVDNFLLTSSNTVNGVSVQPQREDIPQGTLASITPNIIQGSLESETLLSQDESGVFVQPKPTVEQVTPAAVPSVHRHTIRGSLKSETLVGPDGTDNEIFAGAGKDKVVGGLRSDVIYGEEGNDILRGDFKKGSTKGALGGDDIIYGGKGKDQIWGNGGKDKLYGEEGNDKIWGDDGDDLLCGGQGQDKLKGGKGKDTFVVAVSEGTDTIGDFKVGEDFIGLSGQLTFGQLSITQNGKNTLIGFEDKTLAILTGVNASTLTEHYFIAA